jgi:hypothetical protein
MIVSRTQHITTSSPMSAGIHSDAITATSHKSIHGEAADSDPAATPLLHPNSGSASINGNGGGGDDYDDDGRHSSGHSSGGFGKGREQKSNLGASSSRSNAVIHRRRNDPATEPLLPQRSQPTTAPLLQQSQSPDAKTDTVFVDGSFDPDSGAGVAAMAGTMDGTMVGAMVGTGAVSLAVNAFPDDDKRNGESFDVMKASRKTMSPARAQWCVSTTAIQRC